jgi:Domain of unknown function (DUF4190)
MPLAYGTPMYGSSMGMPAYPVRHTNGLAVASLVCSCVGPIILFLPCILGVIFGFVSRSQIRRSNGTQTGGGMALAGIIVGFSAIGLFILIVVLVAVFGNAHGCVGTGSSCSLD